METDEIPDYSKVDGLRNKGGELAARPSCRFLKTVNVTDYRGNTVAVNAQQYTVLLTDVPDLERIIQK